MTSLNHSSLSFGVKAYLQDTISFAIGLAVILALRSGKVSALSLVMKTDDPTAFMVYFVMGVILPIDMN